MTRIGTNGEVRFCVISSFLIVTLFVCSCGGPAERLRETAEKPPAATPSPFEREMSGVYELTGAGNALEPSYTGVLTIANSGDVLTFRRQTNKGTTTGTGVQLGESIAASYASGGNGDGCGVVLYKIAPDGSLEGRSVRWGETRYGTERAVRAEGRNLPGKYNVSGTFAGGPIYSGALTIEKDGSGYDFEWIYSDAVGGIGERMVGFGVWKGSYAAVTFGGRKCSFALYSITGPNTLEGTTGGQRTVTFATEAAARR